MSDNDVEHALKVAWLEETAPKGYTFQDVSTSGLNDADEEVEAVYEHQDGRTMHFPVDALASGFTPEPDTAIIERCFCERPDIAKRALEENKGAKQLAGYIASTYRPMYPSIIRDFVAGLEDSDSFYKGCLIHPAEDRVYTDAELAEMGETA